MQHWTAVAVDHSLHVRKVFNSLTVPKGTASSAPATAPWDLGSVVIVNIEVMIPPGHAGLTGLAIAYSGQQLVPWANGNAWLKGDDLTRVIPFDFQVGRPLTLSGFNTDIFDHTFYLLAEVTDLSQPITATRPGLVPLS